MEKKDHKIIVYSANIGGYDDLKTPEIYDPNIRYILFTDNKFFRSNVWEVNHIDFIDSDLDPRRKSRYIKINPHLILPHHDISIWVDHCFTPRFGDSLEMLKKIKFGNNDIMCYKHVERTCIYDESVIIRDRKLDFEHLVDFQMGRYRNEGFPNKLGLFETGFTIRKNNENTIKFNNTWWGEVYNYSSRDQLSQVYSSWKTKVKINPILVGDSVYHNKYLTPKIKHLKKWSKSPHLDSHELKMVGFFDGVV
jgi:hypothetical protein